MPLKIQYCSDLHLEFRENRLFNERNPIRPVGDLLLLAGDIVLLSRMRDYDDFFDYLSANFAHTYWIPGNHEFYGYDISGKPAAFSEAIRHNVFLVNQQTMVHDDVAIICCSLWSKVQPDNEYQIERNLSDFHQIRNGNKRFTVADYNLRHTADLNYLTEAVSAHNDKRIVVMTHHVPTYLNYPRKYLGSPLSEAFVSEQYDLIHSSGISYWLYGHHHINTPPFQIGETTLITNQLGYVSHYEHHSYARDATFVI